MGASLKTGGSAGGRRRRSRAHTPMSEINVTPFVDVMLVLLIIFMVAAPLLTTAIPIDLPKAKGSPVEAQKKEPLRLNVMKDGRILIGDNDKDPIALGDLIPRLKATLESRGGDDTIFLFGDDEVRYGIVVRVLARIKQSGFQKVSIVTKDEEAGG